jgi:hypothetical protein
MVRIAFGDKLIIRAKQDYMIDEEEHADMYSMYGFCYENPKAALKKYLQE